MFSGLDYAVADPVRDAIILELSAAADHASLVAPKALVGQWITVEGKVARTRAPHPKKRGRTPDRRMGGLPEPRICLREGKCMWCGLEKMKLCPPPRP